MHGETEIISRLARREASDVCVFQYGQLLLNKQNIVKVTKNASGHARGQLSEMAPQGNFSPLSFYDSSGTGSKSMARK